MLFTLVLIEISYKNGKRINEKHFYFTLNFSSFGNFEKMSRIFGMQMLTYSML